MRKLYLIALILMSITVCGQNWNLINSSEKFCYSTDENLEITDAVICVESVVINAGDSLFHLNKVARQIDGQDFECLYNEPQFLLDDVLVKSNGEWIFIDTSLTEFDEIDTFKIIPTAAYYESWQFSNNLEAVVANLSTMDIFGQTDSVKTILLSDYSQILISKNHGIINWKGEYQLIGIEGRGLGASALSFDNMYSNLTAGDVFCFYSEGWQASKNVKERFIKTRWNIQEVNRYQDSIVINVDEWKDINEINWGKSSQNLSFVNKNMVYRRNSFSESDPKEAVYISLYENFAWAYGFALVKLEEFKWGGLKKTVFFEEEYYPHMNLYESCEGAYFHQLCFGSDFLVVEVSEKYGFLEYENHGFEWGGHKVIKGVIENGDTLGIIYPMSIFVGTQELAPTQSMLVYPNPASDFLTINSSYQGPLEYRVCNISGQILSYRKIQKTGEDLVVSVEDLSPGIYIIQINVDAKLETYRFVKR